MSSSKKTLLYAYIIGMFSVCIFLLVLIFPKESKFQYEFSKGSPWLHDDLIAQFDFPVLKRNEVINEKIDSVKNKFTPYYSLDTTVYDIISEALTAELNAIKDNIIENHTRGPISRIRMESDISTLNSSVTKLVKDVYDVGVIQKNDEYKTDNAYIITNATFKKLDTYSLFTKDDVVKKINSLLTKSAFYQRDSTEVLNIYSSVLNKNFYIPNITYNSQLSEEMLEAEINSISRTLGMVQAGELIILKGNIVDELTYTKLLSLKSIYESDDSRLNIFNLSIGIAILLVFLFASIVLYLKYYSKGRLLNYKTATYILLQIILFLLIALLISNFTELSLKIIPFTLIALFILTFYSFHVAFFIYLAAILLIGFVVTSSFEFLFVQIITGLMALFSMRNIQKRRQIFVCLLIVFGTYSLLNLGFVLVKHGSLDSLDLLDFAFYGISAFLLLLYLPLIYLYEKIFGFVSDFSLMELSDTNNALLRQLAENAPGTFQHTLQVAGLTESVVRELGGNALLARTGALYHDIGKAQKPYVFIENQNNGNLHDNFSYEESAAKIIDHVHEGIKLAKKHKLPKNVSDFILMHHGTGKTKYFYNSWKNENPGKEPSDNMFSYPGPKPNTLETAVMMMADSIEAASRTLKSYSDESISNLVNGIINAQLEEKQFDNVDITLKQIAKAKEIFIEKIKNIYHSRIEYPKIKSES